MSGPYSDRCIRSGDLTLTPPDCSCTRGRNQSTLKSKICLYYRTKGDDPCTHLLSYIISDGDLTQALLNPKSKIPRQYLAVVEGNVQEAFLAGVLKEGVRTSEGVFSADLLQVEVLKEERFVQNRSFETGDNEARSGNDKYRLELKGKDEPKPLGVGKPKVNSGISSSSKIKLSVCEGKYRMVRRILHNSGHSVISLHRYKYGNIVLDPATTAEGTVRECSEDEINWAKGILTHEIAGEKSIKKKYVNKRKTERST